MPRRRTARSSSFIRSSYARRIRAEHLEDRRMLAVVGNTLDVVNAPDTSSIAALIADDGGDGISLREAITAANNAPGADTITFDPAVFNGEAGDIIRLSSGLGELEITETLTIDAGGLGVVISGDTAGNDTQVGGVTDLDATPLANLFDNVRVLEFITGSGDLTLRGLTITGGRTAGFAEDGGGILFGGPGLSGTLTLDQSTVSGNSTMGSFAEGGGIYAGAGNVTLTDSTVSGNQSRDDGGGLYVLSGNLTINGSTVSGNRTTGPSSNGGGIGTFSGNVTFFSGAISGNTAARNGGGVSTTSGNVLLVSGTLSGNTAAGAGGGILTSTGDVGLFSSTVTGNQSGTLGGGLFVPNTVSDPDLTISNSIIAGNTAGGSGPDLLADLDGTVDISFSLIGDTSGSGVFTGLGTDNLLNVDPLLGPLADNGGPTQTHALPLNSPAINAGSSGISADQRGFGRNAGGGVDIGAFELQDADLRVSTADDVVDGIFTPGELSLREAIAIAAQRLGEDTVTFDPAVFNGEAGDVIRLSAGLGELEITQTLTIDAGGLGVVISGDTAGNDTQVDGVTDLDATPVADLSDNVRVLNFTGDSGDLTLRGLTITGGRTTGFGEDGGGIRFGGSGFNGLLTLDESTVSGNSTTGSFAEGGGVGAFAGSVTLVDSTVSGNQSNDDGGGLFAYSGNIVVSDSTVSGNRTTGAFGRGGGIATISGDVTVVSGTVSGNSAISDGGGVSTNAGDVTLLSSTVVDNGSGADGGGLFVLGSFGNPTLTVSSSIVAGNTAAGVAPDLRFDQAGAVSVVNSSLIGDTSGSGVTASTGTGNLLNLDPLLGPLANNGGPTQTHALLPGSPAINAGLSGLATDQRGFDRNVGGDDIGAVEAQAFPDAAPGDFNRDGIVNAADYAVWRDTLGDNVEPLRGADGDGDGQVTAADFRVWVSHFGLESAPLATSIDVPSQTAGVIANPGDSAFFSFTAAAGQILSISTSLGSLSNSTLRLLDGASGAELAFDDNSGSGLASRVTFVAPRDGTFFIEVEGTTLNAGTFTLAIAEPTVTPVSVPSVTQVFLSDAGAISFFSFTAATAGQVLDLSTTLGTLEDSTLRVRDASTGAELAFDDDGGVGLGSQITFVAPGEGVFLVEVAAPGTEIGTFTLNVAEPAVAPLSIPSQTAGEIVNSGDRSVFSFNATVGQVLDISTTLGTLDNSTLRVRDATSGAELDFDDDGGDDEASRIIFVVPRDGVFLLEVAAPGPATGTFTLDLVEAVVTPVGIPSQTPGEIVNAGERSLFSFTATAGQGLEISTSVRTLFSSTLLVRDAATGAELASDETIASAFSRSIFVAPSTGTFLVEVGGPDVGVGTGTFNLNLEELSPTPVGIPSQTAGSLENPNDIGLFSFAATAAGQVLDLSVTLGTLDEAGLRVIDPTSGAELASDLTSVADAPQSFFVAPRAGEFLIEVAGLRRSTGTFTLNLEEVSPTPVGIPSQTIGEIENQGDISFFSFDATAGQVFDIATLLGTLGNSTLRVRDTTSGAELAFDDNDGGPGLAAQLIFIAPSDGTFLIEVGGAAQQNTGTFTLDLDERPVTTAGSIDNVGDIFTFPFSATAGQLLEISTTLVSLGGSTLRLRDAASGAELAFDNNSGPGDGSRIVFQTPGDGEFLIEVAGNGASTGTFLLDIDEISPAALSSIDNPGDLFTLPLNATAGQVFDISTVLLSLGDSTLRVRDASGAELEFDNNSGPGNASRTIFVAPSDGEFLVEVAGNNSSTGTFALVIEEVSPTPVVVGTPSNGEIGNEGDISVFSFDAVAGQVLDLSTTLGTLGNPTLRVRDAASGVQLAFNDNGGPGLNPQIFFVAPSTGEFLVEVAGSGDSNTGTFALVVDEIVPTPIAPGTSLGGRIENSGDISFFSLDATAGQVFDILTDLGSFNSGGLGDSTLRVRDGANGVELAFNDNGGPNGASRLIFDAPNNGTFLIEVAGTGMFGTGSFTLSVDEVLTATLGSIDNPGDVFTFPLDATAGQVLDISTADISLGNTTLRVRDANGTQLRFNDNAGPGLNARTIFLAPNDGQFSIEVAAQNNMNTGSFAVLIDEVTPTPLVVGTPLVGEIENDGDIRVFSFNATAGQSLRISTLGSRLDTTLRLRDGSSGEQLAFNDNAGIGFQSVIDFTAPAAGTFLVEVAAFESRTGTFTLRLTETASAAANLMAGGLSFRLAPGAPLASARTAATASPLTDDALLLLALADSAGPSDGLAVDESQIDEAALDEAFDENEGDSGNALAKTRAELLK